MIYLRFIALGWNSLLPAPAYDAPPPRCAHALLAVFHSWPATMTPFNGAQAQPVAFTYQARNGIPRLAPGCGSSALARATWLVRWLNG